MSWLNGTANGNLIPNMPSSGLADVVRATTDPITRGIEVIAAGDSILPYVRHEQAKIDAGGSDSQPINNFDGIGDIVIPFDSGAGWAANGTGTPTLTQDFTGFDSSGDRTGIVSRTGCPAM